MARINSVIDDDLLRQLRHVLVDEGISLSEWIRRQAMAYVAEKAPKGKKRKGKGGVKDGTSRVHKTIIGSNCEGRK